MKPALSYIYFSSLLVFFSFTGYTQTERIDSIKKALQTQKPDTIQINTLLDLSNSYQLFNPDSSLAYAQQALALAEKIHFEQGIFWAEIASSNSLLILGNYPLDLEYAFKAFSLAEILNATRPKVVADAMMSGFYYCVGDYAASLKYWYQVQRITKQYFPDEMWGIWVNFSWIYQGMNKPDSAMLCAQKAFEVIRTNQRLYNEDYVSKQQTNATFTVLGNSFAGKAGV